MSLKIKLAAVVVGLPLLFLFLRSTITAQIVNFEAKPDRSKAPKKILVTYKSTPSGFNIQSTRQSLGGGSSFVGSLGKSGNTRVFVVSNVAQALASARSDPNVSSARVDPVFSIVKVPNDEQFNKQWNLRRLGVGGQGTTAWDLIPTPIGDKTGSIKVAVIDTGIDKDHPELVGKISADANDFVNCFKAQGDTSTDCVQNAGGDVQGHGTHVAGIIGAVTDNAKGIAGVGWGVKIMSVRMLNNQGVGNLSDLIRGLNWATDHGAKVINLSLGAYESDLAAADKTDLQNAINYAYSRGAVLVAAAGNCGGGKAANSDCYIENVPSVTPYEILNEKSYPAASDNVISVAGLRKNGTIAPYSEYGDWVDVAAPGGDNCASGNTCILSLFPAAKVTPSPGVTAPPFYLAYAAGTSMATPHVSAVAALLFASKANLTNTQVVDLIYNNANTTASGYGTKWKYGVTDACRSVYASINNGATPPASSNVCGASTDGGDDVMATPTPFPSGNLCPKKCKEFVSDYSGKQRRRGDANCSGQVTKKDFNILKKQYDKVPPRDEKKNANFQCIHKNGGNPATFKVNLADFEIWRRNTTNFGQFGDTDTDEEGD